MQNNINCKLYFEANCRYLRNEILFCFLKIRTQLLLIIVKKFKLFGLLYTEFCLKCAQKTLYK